MPAIRDRSRTIGGSDMGVIMGFNKYKTQAELWLEKTGRKAPQVFDDLATRTGHYMEPFILDLYEEFHDAVLDRWVDESGKKKLHISFFEPYVAEYDGVDNVNGIVVDAKNKSMSAFLSGFGEPSLQEIPRDIMCQIQFYMWNLGIGKGCIAVSYDSFMYKEFPITRNEALINEMLEASAYFWECVTQDKKPKPRTYREAAMLWVPEPKKMSYATEKEIEAYKRIEFNTKKIKELEEDTETKKKILMDLVLKESSNGILLDKKKIFTATMNKAGTKSGRVNVGKGESDE